MAEKRGCGHTVGTPMKSPLLPLPRLNAAESVFAPFHDSDFIEESCLEIEAARCFGRRVFPDARSVFTAACDPSTTRV